MELLLGGLLEQPVQDGISFGIAENSLAAQQKNELAEAAAGRVIDTLGGIEFQRGTGGIRCMRFFAAQFGNPGFEEVNLSWLDRHERQTHTLPDLRIDNGGLGLEGLVVSGDLNGHVSWGANGLMVSI